MDVEISVLEKIIEILSGPLRKFSEIREPFSLIFVQMNKWFLIIRRGFLVGNSMGDICLDQCIILN